MGGVRLSNKFSYFYIFRDTFFRFLVSVTVWVSVSFHSCCVFFSILDAIVVAAGVLLYGSSCSGVEPFSLCGSASRQGVAAKNIAQVGPNHVAIVALSPTFFIIFSFCFFVFVFSVIKCNLFYQRSNRVWKWEREEDRYKYNIYKNIYNLSNCYKYR